MADAAPTPQTPQAPGQPGKPGGAPFGQTSAVGPTANRGSEAAALQKVTMAVKLLSEAFGEAGATSELGQGLMDPLKKLSKMVVPGSSTPASEKNTMDRMQMALAQQNKNAQMLRQQAMQKQGQPAAPQQQAVAA
jgi:hypothetical protein